MTLFKTEWKLCRGAVTVWSIVLGGLIFLCILLFPDIAKDQQALQQVFSGMGAFGDAFGMDVLNFGTFDGYFSIECGNVLGLGGALFAGMTGFSIISRERNGHTMIFWLGSPLTPIQFYFEKLAALLSFVLVLNLFTTLCVLAGSWMIHEPITDKITMLLIAGFLTDCFISAISFALASVFKNSSPAVGAALALGLWIMDLISRLLPDLSWLKNFSLFGISDSVKIMETGSIPSGPFWTGLFMSIAIVMAGAWIFSNRDIL